MRRLGFIRRERNCYGGSIRMTAEEITEREQSRKRYCAQIEQKCRTLDTYPERDISGIPWLTKSASNYQPRPEIRREW
jgi:hypothetical protein